MDPETHRRPALVPELYVSDLVRSLAFYADLGFRVDYERPEEGFASIALGGAWLMLEQTRATATATAATPAEIERGEWRTAPLERPFGRGINFEITVSDVKAPWKAVHTNACSVVRALHDKTYRVGDTEVAVRQFVIADPDGYLIRFSERLATG